MKLETDSDLKRGIALGLFLFLAVCSFSQTYFSKLLPGWENSYFIETDSSYISIGMNNYYPPYRNFIQINDLDKADLSYSSYDLFIDTQTHTQLHSLTSFNALKHNNQIYIGGDYFTGVGNGTLFKLNKKSDSIIYFNSDTSYWNSRYYGIKPYKKDKFIIIGDYDQPNYKSNTFLKVTDTNGNLLWTKSYTIPSKNIHLHPTDIVSTSDGGFLLLCQEEEPMFQQIGRTIKLFRPLLIKTDSLGNEQWRKNLGDYRYNNFASNIIKGETDTTYFVSWTDLDSLLYNFGHSPDKWHTRANYDATVWLSKIGESGSILWTKNSFPIYQQNKSLKKTEIKTPFFVKQMRKTNDNHIAIGGISNYYCNLAKYSMDGELVWYRDKINFQDTLEFRDANTQLKTFSQTKDQGFIFGGVYELEISPFTRHAYIMKLDQYGCVEPGCHLQDQWYLDSVANTRNKSNKGSSILLYPNPTHGEITIKLPASFSLESPVAVSIISTKGNLVSSFELNDFTTTYTTTHLSKGLYIFKFTSEELGSETIKVVVD
ncbi:MAG: T9SS type A sorting domain-containing protein, partial [Flavobacteriales bacterium]